MVRGGSWRVRRPGGRLQARLGGAIGLIVGELVLGGLRGGVMGRAVSWAIMGLGIGLSQGVASRSSQRVLFGLVGGGLGGLVGGFCFELLRERLGTVYDPARSQGLGIVILGAGLGLFLALVEQVLRRAWVQVLQGRQEGRSYLLPLQSNRLGLDEQAEVGLFGDPEVSRQHAVIEREGGGYVLRDRDGRGRTKVNGAVVPAQEPVTLKDGDRLTLGGTLLVFRQPGSEAAP